MKKHKLVKRYKKKSISIVHRYSISEIGNIETRNSIEYIRGIVSWLCFKAYNFDNTQTLTVQQICDLLVNYYQCSHLSPVYCRSFHQIDLYISEACGIQERKLKYFDRTFHRNGIYHEINKFIDTNKANDYCYVHNK